jgi:hypothetical protein
MLPVSLDCPFVIATSVFSNVYLIVIRLIYRSNYHSQDGEKQNKNKTQYVLETTMRKQTQIT